MREVRRNEFKDLLEMNELMFIESTDFIKVDIPELGACTYYPKKNRFNIHRGNKWESDGFYFVKSHLIKIKNPINKCESTEEFSVDHDLIKKIRGIICLDLTPFQNLPYYGIMNVRKDYAKRYFHLNDVPDTQKVILEQIENIENIIKKELFL